MNDSSSSDEEIQPALPTVGTALGIKGALRFRPHGSSQKAHVVLRRVEISDDSGDDGETKSVVYFSLFAQKRIEVKPGKEILLTVPSLDGKFKDQAVIFEGDLAGDTTESDDEELQGSEEDTADIPISHTIPPKMRRTWNNRFEVSPSNTPPPQLEVSLTLPPNQRLYASAAVQVSPPLAPPHKSISIQAEPSLVSVFAQTIPPVLPTRTSTATQTHTLDRQNVGRNVELKEVESVKAKPEPSPSVSVPDNYQAKVVSHSSAIMDDAPSDMSQESGRERSLSPMDLDSPPSTPLPSPSRSESTERAPSSSRQPSRSPPIRAPAPLPPRPVRVGIVPGFIASQPPLIPSAKLEKLSARPSTFQPPLPNNKRRLSPPPDPKSLAVISSGSIFNPLNIKPSLHHAAQTRLATVATLSTSSQVKKTFVVGSSSPFTNGRASRPQARLNAVTSQGSANPLNNIASTSSSLSPGSLPTPSSSVAPPSTTEVRTPSSPPRSLDLSNSPLSLALLEPPVSPPAAPPALDQIVAYASPSLSPSSNASSSGKPPNSKPNSKWKAVTSRVPRAEEVSRPSNNHVLNGQSRVPPLDLGSPLCINSDPKLERLEKNESPNGHLVGSSRTTTLTNDTTHKGISTIVERGELPLRPVLSIPIVPELSKKGATRVTPTHPLPSKPLLRDSDVGNSPRGTKRGASPDDRRAEAMRPRKRLHQWPTMESLHSVHLKTDGEVGIRAITFNSGGSQFAVCCYDRTIRIWNNGTHTESARLSHASPIVSAEWTDGDTSIVSLCEDGVISKWTRNGQNLWQWSKLLEAGNDRRSEDDSICMAYRRDRIAVSFPKTGVKVWMQNKGTWQPQRSILRQNVTSIKFVEDGDALLGGTRDGVLWYCQVPNGTLRAYAFLKAQVSSIDISATGTHALVGQTGGRAHLVGIRQDDHKGKIEQAYATKETENQPKGTPSFGAIFTAKGNSVLFGCVQGCALLWERGKGGVAYGLDHGEQDTVQAAASFDRTTPISAEGCLVTGTKLGHLTWWPQPSSSGLQDSTR